MKVLIVDDNPMDLSVANDFVSKLGYETVLAESAEDALKIMETEAPPSIILTDFSLPNATGLAFCQQIRQQITQVMPYIIIMTGSTSVPDDIHSEALHLGADDFIEKPLDFKRVAGTLRAADRVISTQLRLVIMNERLDQLASNDELTGLLNRRAGLDNYRVNLSRLKRTLNQSACVILCDVDHFKSINDTYGHAVGDKVLIDIAQRLKHALRPFDVICRYGGEEFFLFCEVDSALAYKLLERLLSCISSDPVKMKNKSLDVTMSIGCYLIDDQDSLLAPSTMIDHADTALYEAKANGRNGYVIYKT